MVYDEGWVKTAEKVVSTSRIWEVSSGVFEYCEFKK